MDHFIKLVDVLVWPITVLALVTIFRAELSKIIGRLSELKYKGLVANFDKQLTEVEKQVNSSKKYDVEIKPISTTSTIDRITNLTNIEKSLYRVSEVSPKAGILEAWTNLELESKIAAEKFKISEIKNNIILEVLKKLIPIWFNETVIESYYNLLALRNQAIHTSDFNISSVDAKRYIDIVMVIAKMMAWRSEREASEERVHNS